MLPEIWGKYGWLFLHLVTLEYPDNPTELDKKHYYEYIHSMQYILPCAKCQYNMGIHLSKYPLNETVLSNKNNLIKWGIDLHNIVNYHTGKPMLTYPEALYEIEKHTKKNEESKANSNAKLWIFIMIIIILILILIVGCLSILK